MRKRSQPIPRHISELLRGSLSGGTISHMIIRVEGGGAVVDVLRLPRHFLSLFINHSCLGEFIPKVIQSRGDEAVRISRNSSEEVHELFMDLVKEQAVVLSGL